MSYLVGLVVAFLLFGGLELVWRALGMPLSVFAALGAVLRQTDVAKLQRRQALTMLLLAAGEPQQRLARIVVWSHQLTFLEMIILPVLICLPAHLVLQRVVGRRQCVLSR